MVSAEVESLLQSLRGDRSIWASAPCQHKYRLADSPLFYGSDVPEAGKEYIRTLRENLSQLNQEVRQLHNRLTEGFTKKSVEVKLGKTVEKIVPALPGFPLNRADCRAIFDPIDYLGFVGLSTGRVSRLEFIDVKTGNARLNERQKAIRDVVEDGKVSIRELGS
jgi:predicted Holliday junction resolvase-like endonuclease